MREILDSFSSWNWRGILSFVRWVFIVLDIILVINFIITLKQAWKHHPKFRYPKRKIRKQKSAGVNVSAEWVKIVEKSGDGSRDALSTAIIEADKLLDDTLIKVGAVGETTAERIRWFEKKFSPATTDSLWQAHNIRNNIVHISGFEISPRQTESVLRMYEEFFKEIKAL
ncbi:hypothetical protein A3I34_03205 [Candidatus Jorgensenbacteria bacterium RIFCSPLOWO2_02_FULL_45_12]|uniref:DUF4145 domain-containing protein n=2 Tax=Candidatus Joergenseniibacteriota TaxID=1752739 RepID=A0A1F6BQF0_9BACT|nr:MAG: hypothetical protein UX22_C0004G0053 [Candidatus Jorgensenbacteria bacterium GW2011_GWA2_45_9]OGG39156.1 MAG: hypothetical protein A3D55_01560 [Candidatus Jorgensenbacteria bacterium RIFCSPHIGHO2_02_FULL_45_20]OGG42210.1 MAG: hypothetical protein A3I34_03205 [Candidatus Jorgensenbacteria bacterium RIFCSPLOWO2_02_FULL_45_12]